MARDSLTLFRKKGTDIVLSLYRGTKGVYVEGTCDHTFWEITRLDSQEIELGPAVIVGWNE